MHPTPLQYYRSTPGEINLRQQEKKSADAARARYEFHLLRIERDQQAKAEKLARHDTQCRPTTPEIIDSAR